MDKTKQIWYRFANDRGQLNVDCVDALSKCYSDARTKTRYRANSDDVETAGR